MMTTPTKEHTVTNSILNQSILALEKKGYEVHRSRIMEKYYIACPNGHITNWMSGASLVEWYLDRATKLEASGHVGG